jgi:hypothetical protein
MKAVKDMKKTKGSSLHELHVLHGELSCHDGFNMKAMKDMKKAKGGSSS